MVSECPEAKAFVAVTRIRKEWREGGREGGGTCLDDAVEARALVGQ